MTQRTQIRTENILIRVTPAEKLAAMRAARRSGYSGSVSAMLRDFIARSAQTNYGRDQSAKLSDGAGTLVTNN